MTVYVYQTFEIHQEKFQEAIENLQEMKKYRNENFNHKVEVLTPISGQDHAYSLLATYDGLGEMELQNKRMFDDDEYLELVGKFFLENIVQGSMHTQFFRVMTEKKKDKEKNDK
ncbi:MAG TPA: hypothetical protein VKZ77_01920 [Bacillaceae bacterium]|nr:hypothetical protein [Bacillaceae bacterium]